MRVDIRRLIAKGQAKKLVDRVADYVAVMAAQGKPLSRAIVTQSQYDTLAKLARNQHARAVLCCGDVLVHWHHDPIDESAPEYKPVPRFDAGLPPVAANPFGVVAAPAKAEPVVMEDYFDDDIPF